MPRGILNARLPSTKAAVRLDPHAKSLAKTMGLVIRGSVLALGHQVPLTIAHAKGVTLCENFQRNAMKSGGEHEFAPAVFPTGSDTGDSGCDARLRASHAHGRSGQ